MQIDATSLSKRVVFLAFFQDNSPADRLPSSPHAQITKRIRHGFSSFLRGCPELVQHRSLPITHLVALPTIQRPRHELKIAYPVLKSWCLRHGRDVIHLGLLASIGPLPRRPISRCSRRSHDVKLSQARCFLIGKSQHAV